jgi:hypothetical protein
MKCLKLKVPKVPKIDKDDLQILAVFFRHFKL